MLRYFLIFLALINIAQSVQAEDWFRINNDWKADRDSIVITKNHCSVQLHNIKEGVYYYTKYKLHAPEKIVREKRVGSNEPVYYPDGNNFKTYKANSQDAEIFKAVTNPSYEHTASQTYKKDTLTCLELKYTLSRDNHSTDMLEYFYIDPANKIVLNQRKLPVTNVEEFNDEMIKFTTRHQANHPDFDIVANYAINRYTGSVQTIHQSCPRNGVAKFSRALTTGVYDITIGEGTGIVNKVNKTSQKF